MTIKEQWEKVKNNWFLVLVVLVVLALTLGFGGSNQISPLNKSSSAKAMYSSMGYDSRMTGGGSSGYYPSYTNNFAPNVSDRLITKTANLSVEVKNKTFKDNEIKAKTAIQSYNGYLLNESVNKYNSGNKEYYTGYYHIKVDTAKYSYLVNDLKAIGKVNEFYESSEDITGRHTDIATELASERERLQRYNELYTDANNLTDKLTLSDAIFNQERTVKSLEDTLSSITQQVDYSTVYFSMTEKQSSYADIVFIKFSELVKALVNSTNSVFKIIFVVIPYILIIGIIVWIVRIFKGRCCMHKMKRR